MVESEYKMCKMVIRNKVRVQRGEVTTLVLVVERERGREGGREREREKALTNLWISVSGCESVLNRTPNDPQRLF